MATTFLTVGLTCLIAAIVGGSLKAFGIEIPALRSTKRQLVLGALGLVLLALTPLVRDRDQGDKPEASLHARGVATMVEKFPEDGKRRARYYVILESTGQRPVNGIKIAVAYYGGDKADVDLNAIDFDPPTRHMVEASGHSSTLISLADPMPPGDKITVHVGDVIARGTEDRPLPELVASAKSETSPNVSIVWTVRNAGG